MHLAGAMLAAETGTSLLHVPYKGSGPALQNLMGNQVDSMFADLMQVLPQIQSGDLKAIAVTSRQRHPLLPNVPTIAETVAPDFDVISWTGIGVPAGTPAAVAGKLNAEVRRALADATVQERLRKLQFRAGAVERCRDGRTDHAPDRHLGPRDRQGRTGKAVRARLLHVGVKP